MDRSTQLHEMIKLHEDARQTLQDLRERYADEPELLAFYEPAAKALVKKTAEQIRRSVDAVVSAGDEDTIWVKVEGDVFSGGRMPISIIGAFLDRLATTTKHAITIVEEIHHRGSRFSKTVQRWADFDLVATRSGSIDIGLQTPSIGNFFPEASNVNARLFTDDLDRDIEQAKEASNKSIDALNLVVDTLMNASHDEHFDSLCSKYGRKNTLRLLSQVQKILPGERTPYNSVTFSGRRLAIDTGALKATLETRKYLNQQERRLAGESQYVEGEGVIRECDLDKASFILRPAYIEGVSYGEIPSRLSSSDDVSRLAEELPHFFGKLVRFNGLLSWSSQGEPNSLEIDSLEPVARNQ